MWDLISPNTLSTLTQVNLFQVISRWEGAKPITVVKVSVTKRWWYIATHTISLTLTHPQSCFVTSPLTPVLTVQYLSHALVLHASGVEGLDSSCAPHVLSLCFSRVERTTLTQSYCFHYRGHWAHDMENCLTKKHYRNSIWYLSTT